MSSIELAFLERCQLGVVHWLVIVSVWKVLKLDYWGGRALFHCWLNFDHILTQWCGVWYLWFNKWSRPFYFMLNYCFSFRLSNFFRLGLQLFGPKFVRKFSYRPHTCKICILLIRWTFFKCVQIKTRILEYQSTLGPRSHMLDQAFNLNLFPNESGKGQLLSDFLDSRHFPQSPCQAPTVRLNSEYVFDKLILKFIWQNQK